MKTQFIVDKLILRTLELVKVNQVLVMPFLIFLLIIVMVLSPIGGVNPFIMVALIALKSVFLAGWLNMFHMALENTKNDGISDDQKTMNSVSLYKEFFPGVGKYFQKIFWGVLILLFTINIIESLIFHIFGTFSTFSLEELTKAMSAKADLLAFWSKISPADKIKIFKIAILDITFVGILSYLTMFWSQSVVAEEKNPVKAFITSIKTILNDPINTILIFVFSIISFVFVFGLNFILGENIFSHLIVLMFSAYFIVYYTMMTFLYFERYR